MKKRIFVFFVLEALTSISVYAIEYISQSINQSMDNVSTGPIEALDGPGKHRCSLFTLITISLH